MLFTLKYVYVQQDQSHGTSAKMHTENFVISSLLKYGWDGIIYAAPCFIKSISIRSRQKRKLCHISISLRSHMHLLLSLFPLSFIHTFIRSPIQPFAICRSVPTHTHTHARIRTVFWLNMFANARCISANFNLTHE